MECGHRSNKRSYLGIFLIVLGGIWIFERLDLVPDVVNDVLISWQMLLIGIGAFSLIGGNRTTGMVLILIGSFFLIPEVLHIPYELRRIGWPLMLVGIGVLLLFRHRKSGSPVVDMNARDMDVFDDFVIFGGREVVINSQNLLGGKTTSIFGGTEYDLRRTQMSPSGAVIDCICVFGGCTLKVPPDWAVKNEVATILGGFADKRGQTFQNSTIDPSKTLIVKGFTAFGGIEVKLV